MRFTFTVGGFTEDGSTGGGFTVGGASCPAMASPD